MSSRRRPAQRGPLGRDRIDRADGHRARKRDLGAPEVKLRRVRLAKRDMQPGEGDHLLQADCNRFNHGLGPQGARDRFHQRVEAGFLLGGVDRFQVEARRLDGGGGRDANNSNGWSEDAVGTRPSAGSRIPMMPMMRFWSCPTSVR
jgi:hypothetical protein